MDSERALAEEEACLYAEWVNLHTGFQTAVGNYAGRFDSPVWAVYVVTDKGAKHWLLSRRAVASFVNRQGARGDG